MQHRSQNILALHMVLVLLLFSACMMQKHAGIDREPVDRTIKASEQYIAQGDYKSALDIYADACRKHPNDQTLLSNYHKAIEDIHHAADEAFSRENFATSGRAYYVLLKNHSSYREFFSDLSFDKGFLLAHLEDSGSQLSQRALAQYRKGNLTEAISIWKSILVFDPNNAGIMKAIDTATTQLKSLQHAKD